MERLHFDKRQISLIVALDKPVLPTSMAVFIVVPSGGRF
jgi:hypothetical protein